MDKKDESNPYHVLSAAALRNRNNKELDFDTVMWDISRRLLDYVYKSSEYDLNCHMVISYYVPFTSENNGTLMDVRRYLEHFGYQIEIDRSSMYDCYSLTIIWKNTPYLNEIEHNFNQVCNDDLYK